MVANNYTTMRNPVVHCDTENGPHIIKDDLWIENSGNVWATISRSTAMHREVQAKSSEWTRIGHDS
jgi:hypothetical protein